MCSTARERALFFAFNQNNFPTQMCIARSTSGANNAFAPFILSLLQHRVTVSLFRYAVPPTVDLQFKQAASLLFDTKGHTTSTSSTYEHSPQFCVTFNRNYQDAVGWKGSFEGSIFISFQHLRVAMAPC
jgi:hypothetical protein